MTSPALPIVTERLTLRAFEKSDLDAVASYHALPDVQRHLDWKARDRLEAKAALEAMRKDTGLSRPGDSISLAIERQRDKVLIGQFALRWHDATAA